MKQEKYLGEFVATDRRFGFQFEIKLLDIPYNLRRIRNTLKTINPNHVLVRVVSPYCDELMELWICPYQSIFEEVYLSIFDGSKDGYHCSFTSYKPGTIEIDGHKFIIAF